MEPLVSILLPGPPRGKARHRSRVVTPKFKKPFVHQYSDPDTVAFEQRLAHEGRIAMAGRFPFEFALTVFIEAFMPIPDSWSGKKRSAAAAGEIFATSKPDYDNIAKICGDALNKIVWIDDSIIVMGQTFKTFSDFPRLRITAWRWDDVGPKEPEML